MASRIQAPDIQVQPVSVTRQMAAALPRLRSIAEAKGLKLHHLGAGYPHPEVSEPSGYVAHKEAYFRHKAAQSDDADEALRSMLSVVYNYTDTLGPSAVREDFARVYGHDFGLTMDPDLLIPTVGATGGISLLCSVYERSGRDVAYIVDAPTYAGFVSRAGLYQRASFYSVEMDDEGPDPDALRRQIRSARASGKTVAFYYTVPDGHNPGGISFSQPRREAVLDVVRDEGICIVEDAPYTYISYYETEEERPSPFIAMDPEHAVHLFTASKIGLPGPRVGFFYSEVELATMGGKPARLRDLVLAESAGDILFHNPEALRGFEAYLHDSEFRLRESLWPIAAEKNAVYGENRRIVLDGLREGLGNYPEAFSWTKPGAGFFSVFTFEKGQVRTDQEFVSRLLADYGVVTIPMFGFYPDDARERNPEAGFDQLRLSFSYSESTGEARRRGFEEAIAAFTRAIREVCGL